MSVHSRSLRSRDMTPQAFFEEQAKLWAYYPSNEVWDEEIQNFLLTCIHKQNTVTIKFPRSQKHRNLNAPKGYSSSSWNANKAKFDPPRGGHGPPQCVNGGFYHHHSDTSFHELHPNVGLETYCLSKPLRAVKSELTRGYRSKTPQPETTEPVELPSSPPVTPLPPSAVESLDEVTNVGPPEADTAAAVALSEGTAETGQGDVVTGTKLPTAEDFNDNVDSGIVLDDNIMSDTEDFVEDATHADTFNGASASQSADSAYGTQPSQDTHDTLPEMDGPLSKDTLPTGNNLNKSSSTSILLGNGMVSQSSDQPRKKLAPKIPHATRRSSRLSQVESAPSSPGAALTSVLGKHGRKEDEDIDAKVEVPKRKTKRTKATRP